jgi:molybdenum cofactor cytidylyltransferase
MSDGPTFAVIPAAGQSSRMGRPKLALPVGSTTVIGTVITALRQATIDHVLVVLGPGMGELARLAEECGANVCTLPDTSPDMRATVEFGLKWIQDRHRPDDQDSWLLAPADQPKLDAGTIQLLLAARRKHPEFSIWVPTYAGRRGHPTLMLWQHVKEIRKLPATAGINFYVRSQSAMTLEVPVSTPAILGDLDTPEDYRRLLEEMGD